MSLATESATVDHDREEFGDCDDSSCDGTAYYLVRDRKDSRQVTVCGMCLSSLRGDKR